MRKKTSNLKTVVHFSLAIGLIVGIWMMSNSGTSNYKSSEKVADFKKESKRPNFNKDLNINNADKSLKNEEIAKSDKALEETAEESTIIKKNTIASMRTTFDCTNPDEVKIIQKELNLVADGIYGPKTEAAWKAKLASLDGVKSTNVASTTNTTTTDIDTATDDSQTTFNSPQPKVETDANVIVKTNTKPTALNSSKPTDPNNNAMLD